MRGPRTRTYQKPHLIRFQDTFLNEACTSPEKHLLTKYQWVDYCVVQIIELSEKKLKNLIKTLKIKHMEYACSLWDTYTKAMLGKSESVLPDINNTSIASDVKNNLSWPPIQERQIQTQIFLFYKIFD